MLERSSRRSVALLVLLAACGSKKPAAPEADPAKLAPIFKEMVMSYPGPGMKECTGEEVVGGATMSAVTFFNLAKYQYDANKPENAEYVNPPELDSPAARTLIDAKASDTDKRRAAAELLSAPFYLVYNVDYVNAPMALMVKELKRGTVGARAIRFEKNGKSSCVRVFYFQNDLAVSDSAIKRSNKAQIDPAIAKELQDDLHKQMLVRIPLLTQPQQQERQMGRVPDNMGG